VPELLLHFRPIDGSVVHLAARDVRLAVVSRAPLAQIAAFKKRMGWRFQLVSSNETDFNYDYQVSMTKEEMSKGEVYYTIHAEFPSEERPARACSTRCAGNIFRQFELRSRADILIGAYNWLDSRQKDATRKDWRTAWLGAAHENMAKATGGREGRVLQPAKASPLREIVRTSPS